MTSKQKKYTEADLTAARMQGREEAKEHLQERINMVCTANHLLLLEVLRIDWTDPVNGVVIPMPYCEKIVKKLKKVAPGYAKRLQQYRNKSESIQAMVAVSKDKKNIADVLEDMKK